MKRTIARMRQIAFARGANWMWRTAPHEVWAPNMAITFHELFGRFGAIDTDVEQLLAARRAPRSPVRVAAESVANPTIGQRILHAAKSTPAWSRRVLSRRRAA